MEEIELKPDPNYETIDEVQTYQEIELHPLNPAVPRGQVAAQNASGRAGNRGPRPSRTQATQSNLHQIQEVEEAGEIEGAPAPQIAPCVPPQNPLSEYADLLNRPEAERSARNTFQQVRSENEDQNRLCCLRCLPTHAVMGFFVAEAILSTIWLRFGAFLLYEVEANIFTHAEGLLPIVTFFSASQTLGPFWEFACGHFYTTVRLRRTVNHATRMMGFLLTVATIFLVFFLSIGVVFNSLFSRSVCYGLLGGSTTSLLTALFRLTTRVVVDQNYFRSTSKRHRSSETLEHFLEEGAKALALAASFLLIPLFKMGVSLILARIISNVCVIFVIPIYILMRYDIRDIRHMCCTSPEEDFEEQMNAIRINQYHQLTTVPFYTKCKIELSRFLNTFKLPLFVPCVIINAIVGIISLVYLTSLPLMFYDKYYKAVKGETPLGNSIVTCTLIGLVYGVVAFLLYILISLTDNMNWKESSMAFYLLGLSCLGFNMLCYYVFDVMNVILWVVVFAAGYCLVSYFEKKAFHVLFKDQDEGHFHDTWSCVKFASGILIYWIYIVIFILHLTNTVLLATVLRHCMFLLAGIGVILFLYLVFHRVQCRPPVGQRHYFGWAPLNYEFTCWKAHGPDDDS